MSENEEKSHIPGAIPPSSERVFKEHKLIIREISLKNLVSRTFMQKTSSSILAECKEFIKYPILEERKNSSLEDL